LPLPLPLPLPFNVAVAVADLPPGKASAAPAFSSGETFVYSRGMVDLRGRGLGLLGLVLLCRLVACGGEAPASVGGSSTSAASSTGGGSTTGSGGSMAVGGGSGGASVTTGVGGGGAPPACALPGSTIPELVEPDPRRPWAGALTIIPSSTKYGVQVAGWRVDGAAMPTPSPAAPYSVLDTRKLSEGLHALSIDVVSEAGEVHTADTGFCVENGPPATPSFQGQMVDVTVAAGLPKGPGPDGAGLFFFGAVAGDLDGDGDDDLFAWTFAGGQVYAQVSPMVFVPQGPVIPGVRSAGLADLDNDGDLDLVAAGIGVMIFENLGGALSNVTASAGLPAFGGGLWDGFKSVGFADLDQDGLLDVLTTQMDCKDGVNLVLRNEGGLHFADVAPQLMLDHPDGSTWGISADLLQDGSAIRVVLYYESFCKPGLVDYYHFLPGPDLPLIGSFQQQKMRRVSPMGDAWFDADGDGLLDHWLAAHTANPLWRAPDFQTSLAAYVGIDTFVNDAGAPFAAWSMVVLDADLDGKTDVYVSHDPTVDDPAATLADSRDGLFWQKKPGVMRDVAAQAGLVGPNACRSAFGSDLDGDGDTDLLVGCRGSLRVLRNDLVDPSAGRTLMLHGTVSNADGVHAIVTTPGGELRMLSGTGQPFAGGLQRQSVRAPSGELSITWPSGIVQKVDAGSASVLHVVEPAAIDVAPRRVPTGGGQSVSVQVNPAALGTPDAAVVVTKSAGVWSKAPVKEADGIWRGTLTPPAATATVVLGVTIGNQTLRIRPHVFVR
jgi:hypothetical protein